MNPLLKYKNETGKTWEVISNALGVTRQRAHQIGKLTPKDIPRLPVRIIEGCKSLGVDMYEWAKNEINN